MDETSPNLTSIPSILYCNRTKWPQKITCFPSNPKNCYKFSEFAQRNRRIWLQNAAKCAYVLGFYYKDMENRTDYNQIHTFANFRGLFFKCLQSARFCQQKTKNLLTNVSRHKNFCCVQFGSVSLSIATKNVCKMAVLQTKKSIFGVAFFQSVKTKNAENPHKIQEFRHLTGGTPWGNRTLNQPLGGACYIHLTKAAYDAQTDEKKEKTSSTRLEEEW